MPTDPVCGMFVPEGTDLRATVDGQEYYFCSKSCLNKFASPESEKKKLRARLVVGWSLSIPIILISYLYGQITSAPYFLRDIILLALATPVQFYSGFGFYQGAYHALRSRYGNMDLLIIIGSTTAFIFSAYSTFIRTTQYGGNVYFDASAFIITLILTGSYIEEKTKLRANRSANKLLSLIPSTSHLLAPDGNAVDRETESLAPGDLILVKPGERFPVDGLVREGKSEVDESMITGEQEPRVVSSGDKVFSGTLNLNGALCVSVLRVGRNSTVGQIFDLISKAIAGRSRVQRLADVFSSLFIPVVLTVAVASSIFWYFYLSSIGYPQSIEIAILAFVSVVVISCPCAIGLAGPITLLIASSSAAEHGTIIKNSGALDRLSRTTIVIFDKTGTLTEEFPTIEEILPASGVDKNYLMEQAASVEVNSNHPIAKAIVKAAQESGVQIRQAQDILETPGVGIAGKVDGRAVEIHRARSERGSTIAVEIDHREIGKITLSYGIRGNAYAVVRELASLGILSAMVTGDSEIEASRVAAEIGIKDVHAGASPAEKADIVRKYQEDGHFVLFVGDGINDSGALQTADVGIVVGSGSDVAKEYGDIVLLNNDLSLIIYAIILGKAAINKIKQNIAWAVGYNAVLIPVAAGITVPLTGLSIFSVLPIMAALAMGLSSSSVVSNSMLLHRKIISRWDHERTSMINRLEYQPGERQEASL
ncbi:MAG: cation-translocating P-type ATPase [Thermoplasmataceae archaeon]